MEKGGVSAEGDTCDGAYSGVCTFEITIVRLRLLF